LRPGTFFTCAAFAKTSSKLLSASTCHTGLSIQQTDLAAKKLELLREAVPDFRRLAILANVGSPASVLEKGEVDAAARMLNLDVVPVDIRRAEDIVPAFAALKGRAEALYVCGDALITNNRIRIITLALGSRLATMYPSREPPACRTCGSLPRTCRSTPWQDGAKWEGSGESTHQNLTLSGVVTPLCDPNYSQEIHIFRSSTMTDQRPRNLVVAPDLDNPGYLWRVEWFDSDGAGYITIFAGQEAEARAKDYHNAIKDGRLDSRIADAQRGGPFTISERPAPRRRKRA
jgi:hypothetical protein